MYEAYFGLQRKPFTLDPDPDFLYRSGVHRLALTRLQYALTHDHGFSLITGEVGSGKTTLVSAMIDQIGEGLRIALVNNTHEAFGTLLQLLSMSLGLDYDQLSNAALFDQFARYVRNEHAAGNRVIILIDEAQNLSARSLEELRVLSNVNEQDRASVRIILVGQPELRDTMRMPKLRQLMQRIGVEHHIGNLGRQDTRNYVYHRLVVAGCERAIFTEPAIDFIHWVSGGIPRLINQLCDTALVYGFADQSPVIDSRLAWQVIQDRCESGVFPGRPVQHEEMAGEAQAH